MGIFQSIGENANENPEVYSYIIRPCLMNATDSY
jgi:hypothetical protein